MITALIPVKSLTTVKNRLAPVLTPDQRRTLVGAMLEDLLEACAAVPLLARTVVISRDGDVRALSAARGAETWAEPSGGGLNGAVNWATERAVAEGAGATLVITGDCPLAMPPQVERVIAAGAGGGVVYVPSADGTGTNAVFRRPGDTVPIAFGPHSLARHQALAAEAGFVPRLVACPSIALDIDTPADLAQLARADPARRSVACVRAWLASVHA